MSTIKYYVNDFINVVYNGVNNKHQYSIGYITSVSTDTYTVKLLNTQEVSYEIKIFDAISDIIPAKTFLHYIDPRDDDIICGSGDSDYYPVQYDPDDVIYDYFTAIMHNPKSFINKKITETKPVTAPVQVVTMSSKPVIAPVSVVNVSAKPCTSTTEVRISKCVHGKDCERLACRKGPEFCPHGEGCERLMCKALYY